MRPIIELNSFSAVAAGQTANLVLDPGVTYDQIYLEVPHQDDIEKVTMKLNAEEIFSLTPDEIYHIQFRNNPKAMKIGFATLKKYIVLPMQLLGAKYDGTQRMTGLVLGPGDNCVIDVKISSTATAPTLSAFAETRAFPGQRQLVRKFERYTVPVAAAGEVNFTSLQRGSRIVSMYFKSTAGINGLEVVRDGVKVWHANHLRSLLVNNMYGVDVEFEGETFQYVFDPVREGFPLKDAMSTAANSLNFKIDAAGADNIEIIVERLEPMKAVWQAAATPVKPTRRGIGRR